MFNKSPRTVERRAIAGPIRILAADLSLPLPELLPNDPGTEGEQALLLARLFGCPIGVLNLKLSQRGLPPDELAAKIWDGLGPAINEQLRRRNLPEVAGIDPQGIRGATPACASGGGVVPLGDAPSVTIVVATRDRAESLARCLPSLLSLDYPNYDIIVVDNAPSSDATARLISREHGDSSRVRYIREDVPGLAVAHNRALPEITSTFVAFTDDDVVVEKNWLTEIVNGFAAAENVACVTGLIFPAELETPAQIMCETYWGIGKGFSQRVFDLRSNRPSNPLYPYSAGIFGSGANMAFPTAALREMGGFDPALGAGTIARGGDDLAAFFEVVRRGYKLVYQPSAMIHHWHRRDLPGLKRQAFGYGAGLTAYLTRVALRQPWRALDLLARSPYAVSFLLRSRSSDAAKAKAAPAEIKRSEWLGMLWGPVAYLRSQRKVRRHERNSRLRLTGQPVDPRIKN